MASDFRSPPPAAGLAAAAHTTSLSPTAATGHIRQLLSWLGDRESQLQLALEAADLGMWHWNPATGELLWSDRVRSLIGVPTSTPASYETFMGKVHPDDRDSLSRGIETALCSGGAYSEEFRIVLENGAVRWLHALGRAQFWKAQGSALRMSGILRDITASRQASDGGTGEPVERQERFRPGPLEWLADAAQIGIVLTNVAGEITYANPAWMSLTAAELDPVVGHDWISFLHADDQARIQVAWHRALHGRQFDLQFRYRRPSAEVRWVQGQVSALKDPSGVLLGSVCTCLDITEQLHERAAADRAHSQARMLARRVQQVRTLELSELASTLQDDVCEGLMALRGGVDRLLADPALSTTTRAECKSLSQLAANACENLRQLLFDLTPPSIAEVGFSGALERLVHEHAKRSGKQLLLSLPEEPIQVAQSTLAILFSVAQEAIANAVEHANATRIDVRVELRVDSIRLRVTDNGVGMNDKDRHRPGSVGLLAATDRMAQIGGALRTVSVARQGTTLEATAPVNRRNASSGDADYII